MALLFLFPGLLSAQQAEEPLPDETENQEASAHQTPGSLLFFETVLYLHRFELYGVHAHDIVTIHSPGVQFTWFKSFGNPGLFVQTTLLLPGEARVEPSPSLGNDYTDTLESGLRIGFDALTGPAWVFSLGPVALFAGGGIHTTALLMAAEYGWSAGLGLTARVLVPFTEHFHMQMGLGGALDIVGDMIYRDFEHRYFRTYTFGFSAGFGLTF